MGLANNIPDGSHSGTDPALDPDHDLDYQDRDRDLFGGCGPTLAGSAHPS